MFCMVDVWSCALGVRGQSVEPKSRMFLTRQIPSLHPPSLHRPSHKSTPHCSRPLVAYGRGPSFANPFLAIPFLGQCGVCVCCVIVRLCVCVCGQLPQTPCAGPPKIFALFLPFSLPFAFFVCLWGSSRGILVVFFEGRETQMCTFGLSGCRVNPGSLVLVWRGAPLHFRQKTPSGLCVHWPLGSEAGALSSTPWSQPDKPPISAISPGDSRYLVGERESCGLSNSVASLGWNPRIHKQSGPRK